MSRLPYLSAAFLALVAALDRAAQAAPEPLRAGQLLVAGPGALRAFRLGDPDPLPVESPFVVDAQYRFAAIGPDGHVFRPVAGGIEEYTAGGALVTTHDVPAIVDPRDIVVGNGGDLVICDSDGTLHFFSRLTNSLGLSVPGVGAFRLAMAPNGRLYAALSQTTMVIAELDQQGNVLREVGPLPAGQGAMALAFGPSGQLYLAIEGEPVKRIEKWNAQGITVGSWTLDPVHNFIWSLAFGPDGRVYAGVTEDGITTVNRIVGLELGSAPQADEVASVDLGASEIPLDLTFVPHRFKVRARGTLRSTGLEADKVTETMVVSVTPGSGMLLVAGAPAGSLLQDSLALAGLACHGQEAFEGAATKTRLFSGVQVGRPAEAAAFLSLDVKGAVDGDTGAFAPEKVNGILALSSANGSVRLALDKSKLLNEDD